MGEDFLLGTKVVEEIDSSVNGTIRVIKSMGFGTYFQVGGLTQSGGVVIDVWRTILKKLKTNEIKSCVILGLGGGSASKLVRKYWPGAKIIGVDKDLVIVELGRKYLGLNELNIEVLISDAASACRQLLKKGKKHDLILVDLYVGDNVPGKFETNDFIKLTTKLISKKGVVVFNRLYYGEKRPQAMRFLEKLEKVFAKVDLVYPQANVMFLCYNK